MPDFWIGRQTNGYWFRECRLAFAAPDRAAVNPKVIDKMVAGAKPRTEAKPFTASPGHVLMRKLPNLRDLTQTGWHEHPAAQSERAITAKVTIPRGHGCTQERIVNGSARTERGNVRPWLLT